MKKNLLFLSLTGAVLMAVPVMGHDSPIVIPLRSSKAMGVDTQFQYNDGGRTAGANVYYTKSNEYIGFGIENPVRRLHVKAINPGQFESASSGNAASLDFNHPTINTGSFGRIDWRSNVSTGGNEQFAAIDVFFENKNNGDEDAAMRFTTVSNGSWSEAMRLRWGRVGIGTETPGFNLDVVEDNQYTTAARIINTYDGSQSTVLRLHVGRATPTSTNNYIEFRAGAGAGTTIAAIDGDGAGGVTYKTSGSDFAEYLPLAQREEVIEAGDIVGLFGGSISKLILHSSQMRVISSAPGVLGNFPGEKREHLYGKVAFLGQVPVKVRGPVQRGDFIVPSGLNDGTGVAVSPNKLTADKFGRIVGVAWQDTSDSEGISLINTEVGLHSAIRLLGELSMRKEKQLEGLLITVQAMQGQLNTLEDKMVEIKN